MQEEWKPIKGFEGLYSVSNFGNVKALERVVENNGGLQHKHERILKPNYNGANRGGVVLCKNGKTYPRAVHRLVAEAFIPNPDGKPVVDHIDTNVRNNHVDNLRWATVRENCLNPLTRVHNSESKKGHPFYGRPLTAEERERVRQSNVGRKASAETRKELSESHKNSELAQIAARENIKKSDTIKYQS